MTTNDPKIKLRSGDLPRASRPHAPARLAHFVLKTPRPAAMTHWYTTVLDGVVTFQDRMLTFITYDEEHHRVALMRLPAFFKVPGALWRLHRKFWGVDHIAFTYDSLQALVATYRRLADQGIKPVWCINHGPTTSMYYEDPDGNRLEFQVDNFATTEELIAWFESGEFVDNPIGVNFDPEVLERKLVSGVPHADLIRRGSAPPERGEPRAGRRALTWRTL